MRKALGTFAKASAAVFILFTAVACGTWTPPSPTRPSPTGGGGATIAGTVQGFSSASTPSADSTGSTLTVTVGGTSQTVAVDRNGRFVLTGVPSGTIELKFNGPGIDATLMLEEVGSSDSIELVVTVRGQTVTVEYEESVTTGGRAELEGLIAAVNPNGTERTLMVRGMTVKVPEAAEIRRDSTPKTFDDLKVGQRVHVRGTKTGDMVIASLVMMQGDESEEDEDDEESDKGQNVNVKGSASAVAPGCPNTQFVVAGWTVVTNSSTDWKKGGCGLLVNGVSVHVKGRVQSDGQVLAEWVMFQ